eukprot:356375-Prymnesium_polylepis.1
MLRRDVIDFRRPTRQHPSTMKAMPSAIIHSSRVPTKRASCGRRGPRGWRDGSGSGGRIGLARAGGGRAGPVSYTHLRAHETLMNL